MATVLHCLRTCAPSRRRTFAYLRPRSGARRRLPWPGGGMGRKRAGILRRRPYFVEHTGTHLNSDVKPRKARLVPRWGTARENLRVLSAFAWRAPSNISKQHTGSGKNLEQHLRIGLYRGAGPREKNLVLSAFGAWRVQNLGGGGCSALPSGNTGSEKNSSFG